MSSKITRRSFVRSSVAIPFIGAISWCGSPEHSHSLIPFEAWGIFAGLSIAIRKPFIVDGVVPNASASVLAHMVIEVWDDIPWYLDFCNGIKGPSPAFDIARSWLTGDGWERRMRAFLGFVRQGAFRVERQGNLVVLFRGKPRSNHDQTIHFDR